MRGKEVLQPAWRPAASASRDAIAISLVFPVSYRNIQKRQPQHGIDMQRSRP